MELNGWKQMNEEDAKDPELFKEVIKVTLFSKNHLNMGTWWFKKCN